MNTPRESIPLRSGKGPPIAIRRTHLLMSPISEPTILTFQNTSFEIVSGALKAQFGEFPIRLSRDKHMPALTAMANLAKSMQADTPFAQMIDYLTKFGELEINEK